MDTVIQIAQQNQQRDPDGLMRLVHIIGNFYGHNIDEKLTVVVLLTVIFLDIFLGSLRAWIFNEFSSWEFRKGFAGHMTTFFIVALIYPFVEFAGFDWLGDSVAGALSLGYLSSCLANAAALDKNLNLINGKAQKYIEQHIDAYKFDDKVNHPGRYESTATSEIYPSTNNTLDSMVSEAHSESNLG